MEGLLKVSEVEISLLGGDPAEWVSMTFDPELQVNMRPIISVMRGERVVPSAEVWLDMKQQVADMLDQFIELRRSVAAYEAEAE